MSTGPEFTHVESPFIDQLVSMGWLFTTGNLDPDGRDLDYNWDYLSVRVGVALGR